MTSKFGATQIGLVQFPGSNCDADCIDAFKRLFQIDLQLIWHEETSLPSRLQGLILPGGFSYGDYLRSGALASISPIMQAVKGFVGKGGSVIGICNGFQVLTESKLLPGALLKNDSRKFICEYAHLSVAGGDSVYHRKLKGSLYKVPIAHGEGRYYVDSEGLKKLGANGQILFQYAGTDGVLSEASNPNGAISHIAGIVSENGRVLGMMPHPERASSELLGSADGQKILEAFLETVG
ncbi:MAG: phosphoribosylformylglycinamidine synthase subunit PurQ [Chitinophagaceae bacterium]|nr:phosphoribosylformylglycinamidine synthase subunit PurQ [Oligoflexus sp.]